MAAGWERRSIQWRFSGFDGVGDGLVELGSPHSQSPAVGAGDLDTLSPLIDKADRWPPARIGGYVQGQTLVAFDVSVGDEFSYGETKQLFSNPAFLDHPLFRRYDVAPDGQSFVLV